MKNFLRALFILLIAHISLIAGQSHVAFAQNSLQYPIADLGYCRDARECFLYCDIPAHMPACWSYATFILDRSVLGVTSDEQASQAAMTKKYGVTFPIAQLGNCASVTECRTYCEDPAHRDTCSSFAKAHGLQKKEDAASQLKKQQLLDFARTEIGCSSYESCRVYCQEHPDLCQTFARRHGATSQGDNQGDQRGGQLLEMAKTELGCDSTAACRQICETDKKRCQEFMRTFASSRPKDDVGHSQGTSAAGFRLFTPIKPTESELRAHCEATPSACPGFKTEQSRQYPKPPLYPIYGATGGATGTYSSITFPSTYPTPTTTAEVNQTAP